MVSVHLAVAAVDEDVSLVEPRCELINHGIGAAAGLDHHDDLARSLQRGHQVFERRAANQSAGRVRMAVDKGLHLLGGPVVDRDAKAVVGNVEGQILAHYREADEADLGALVVRTACAHSEATKSSTASTAWSRFCSQVRPDCLRGLKL
jgi:hypothetical protein